MTPSLIGMASAELDACRGTPEELPGLLHNLAVAEALGQLHRDFDGDRLVGFVGWIRLTLDQLLLVARHQVRLFQVADNTPGAPVLLLMEQLIEDRSLVSMQRRKSMLAAQPGVQILAGWKGARLRVYRVK